MSRTVTATEKLRAVNEGRLQKAEFVRQTASGQIESSTHILRR